MARKYDKNTSTKILEFIDTYSREERWAPSVREIAKAVGVYSTSTVFAHLERLTLSGLIEKQEKSPRALRITRKGAEFLETLKGGI